MAKWLNETKIWIFAFILFYRFLDDILFFTLL